MRRVKETMNHAFIIVYLHAGKYLPKEARMFSSDYAKFVMNQKLTLAVLLGVVVYVALNITIPIGDLSVRLTSRPMGERVLILERLAMAKPMMVRPFRRRSTLLTRFTFHTCLPSTVSRDSNT